VNLSAESLWLLEPYDVSHFAQLPAQFEAEEKMHILAQRQAVG